MKAFELGNYFEDFEVGAFVEHQLSKTIFESDNNLFSLLTMNMHPLHTNLDYAEHNQHGKILVVGMTVPDISGKAVANLVYENIEHLAPVFIGDSLYATTEILAKQESKSKSDRGVVYVETIARNQRQEPVLKFRRKVLIKKRPI